MALCVLQHTVEVLSLLSDDVETDDASPGENLKLRLKGIEEEEILPGFILCSPDNLCHSGRTFDAQVKTRDVPSCWISSHLFHFILSTTQKNSPPHAPVFNPLPSSSLSAALQKCMHPFAGWHSNSIKWLEVKVCPSRVFCGRDVCAASRSI